MTLFFTVLLAATFSFAAGKKADPDPDTHLPLNPNKKSVAQLIDKVKTTTKARNYKWDMSIFVEEGWQIGGHSVDGYPLIYYSCGEPKSGNSSLVLSTVHGDEVAPVYFGFRIVEWLKARPQICEKRHIVIAPIVNPDGFFRYTRGTRTNFRKVDPNRNFDTPDWPKEAHKQWVSKGRKERRYFPGEKPASEPETIFQQMLIEEHKPSKIMSIHAPLNIFDYDGPMNPLDGELEAFSKVYVDSCETLKSSIVKTVPDLKFHAYGIFPGSLGNYAGKQRGIPTFTIEFPTTSPNEAPYYFGSIERGTRIFFEYELNGARSKISKR